MRMLLAAASFTLSPSNHTGKLIGTNGCVRSPTKGSIALKSKHDRIESEVGCMWGGVLEGKPGLIYLSMTGYIPHPRTDKYGSTTLFRGYAGLEK